MTAALSRRVTELLPEVERALHRWLPEQRWFDVEDRTPDEIRLRVVADLTDQLDRGGPCGLLTVAEVCFGGEVRRYQLPIGIRYTGAGWLGSATIHRVGGFEVYDATADGQLIVDMLALIRGNRVCGSVQFSAEPCGESALGQRWGMSSRSYDGERTNTALVVGERYVLTLFRRVAFGGNPDLTPHRVLTRAGSEHVAPLLGAIEGTVGGAPVTFGMVRAFHSGALDGWQAATANVAEVLSGAATDFRAEARLLGETVAAVHAGLAGELGTAVLDAAELARLSLRMCARLDHTLDTVPALAPYAERLRAVFAGVADLPVRGTVVQRVHGDPHLGQVVRTPARWLLVDFDGRPAAPLAERIAMHSPLRDLAGMLRSFDHAAHHEPHLRTSTSDRRGDGRAAGWLASARNAFLDGYAEVSGVDPRERPGLLTAYELDLVVREIGHDARDRPSRAWVPLRAVHRLVAVERVESTDTEEVL
jgi:maltokinase